MSGNDTTNVTSTSQAAPSTEKDMERRIADLVAASVNESTKEKDAKIATGIIQLERAKEELGALEAKAKAESESLQAKIKALEGKLAESNRLLTKCHDWFLDHLRRKGRSFGVDNFNEVRRFLGIGPSLTSITVDDEKDKKPETKP